MGRRRLGFFRLPGCLLAFVLSFFLSARLLAFLDAHRGLLWSLITLVLAIAGGLLWYGLRRVQRGFRSSAFKALEVVLVVLLVWGLLHSGWRSFEALHPTPQPPDTYARRVSRIQNEVQTCLVGWQRFRDWETAPPVSGPDRVAHPDPGACRLLNAQLDSGWETFQLSRDPQSIASFLEFRRQHTRRILAEVLRHTRHELDSLQRALPLAQVAELPEEIEQLQRLLERR